MEIKDGNNNSILITSHAQQRMQERLTYQEKAKKFFITHLCFSYWNYLLSNAPKCFHIEYKGVRWIFEVNSSDNIVLVTVIVNMYPNSKNITPLPLCPDIADEYTVEEIKPIFYSEERK